MAVRPNALYQQVAAEMRKKIKRGTWKAGEQIPTEEKLTAAFGVSRPTIRQAVAELRAEGLLDVQQGRGSYVRYLEPPTETVWIDQAVTWDGTRYDRVTQWHTEGDPTTLRVRIDSAAADCLHVEEGEAAYLVSRTMVHESSRTRAKHTTLLPMEAIAGTPLADHPAVSAPDAYTQLHATHGPLLWREAITARTPAPDERAALQLTDTVPVLVSQRLTMADNGTRRLILETTTVGANGTNVIYTHGPSPL
ncbi:GntR family transcriptional regulator [Streptomyces tateyamensis]|uniref:GntR family transcriptional regulator n=1 Tax=Streptomyces tateyamensis TaxID=565073 RepID=A0A2V4NQX9_9ACTN|nr:GntR family transcriptional regulator [Streptomyces tateyamensis]PYC78613.1 GntR family transcriptional regulator [Streptomyces tateyamensis]